jgi:uncharacterized protein (UPF0276 family)
VTTRDRFTPAIRASLEDAGLRSVAHFEEIDLLRDVPNPRSLERLWENVEVLDPLWVEEDLGNWTWGGTGLNTHIISPILDRDSLEMTVRSVDAIQEHSGRLFLLETPPMMIPLGEIPMLAFIGEVARRTGCGLIFDVGHYLGWALIADRSPEDDVDRWEDIDHVVEMHIAGYELYRSAAGALWLDRHSVRYPDREVALLRRAVRRATGLRAVTVENEGAPIDVMRFNLDQVHAAVSA